MRNFFATWTNMMARCYDDSGQTKAYINYGARGIVVCSEWHNPTVFIAWCREQNPGPKLSLDRRENDQEYSPENCRFITQAEQNRNRRNTVWVDTPKGRMVQVDAAKAFGLKTECLRGRIRSHPNNPEKWFLTKEPRDGSKRFEPKENYPRKSSVFIDTPKGKMTITEAALAFNIPKGTLWRRVKRQTPDKWFVPVGEFQGQGRWLKEASES